jgi:hypothetical protein
MNLTAYAIYILITYVITVHVGLQFYRNGRHYILALFQGNEKYTDHVNHLLLVGYYLVNLGYAALMISSWGEVVTITDLVNSLANRIGAIMILLAVLHYFNMTAIILLTKFNKHITNQLN